MHDGHSGGTTQSLHQQGKRAARESDGRPGGGAANRRRSNQSGITDFEFQRTHEREPDEIGKGASTATGDCDFHPGRRVDHPQGERRDGHQLHSESEMNSGGRTVATQQAIAGCR